MSALLDSSAFTPNAPALDLLGSSQNRQLATRAKCLMLIFAGGSSEIQTIQPSNDSICLGTYLSNQTSLDFTFTVSGVANQCARGFETSWSGGKEDGPYNFTIIPLDQGFRPFDVALQQDVPYESDWVLNLTAGSRFTVMYK